MAYTIEQVEALETAIANGVKDVQYSDKRVSYRSIDDMLKVLTLMKKELGLIPKSGRKLAQTSKGLLP